MYGNSQLVTKVGFTLVELSIVLVIIGLLIGGILVGQSLMDSAKINAQLQQIQQFDAATLIFKSKYKYLPGDAPAFGGDGDGSLEYLNMVTSPVCEMGNFWSSLDPSQFARSACVNPGARVITSGTGKNFPLAKMGKKGSFVAVSSSSPDACWVDNNNRRNFYMILDPSHGQTIQWSRYNFVHTTTTTSAVTTNELAALDQKADDSIYNTGNILAGSITGCPGISFTPDPNGTSCISGGRYNLQNSNYECTPLIRIGAQTGSVQ